MPGSRSAQVVDVTFDPVEVRQLVADLRGLAAGKVITAALRRNLRKAAEPIRQQVQANAAWSTRIPAAVAIGTAFNKSSTGVFIRVNARKAPHARPFENSGLRGVFRHPVFASDVWVAQQSRPFFFNETDKHAFEVEVAVAEAVEIAAVSAGFR